jgi:Domain of unknown function (DUF6457)
MSTLDSTLDDWTDAVRDALGLGPVDTTLVLDLAREVAHGVTRPAAPLSAYLLGLAVGRGAEPRQAAAAISDLARGWPPPPAEPSPSPAEPSAPPARA